MCAFLCFPSPPCLKVSLMPIYCDPKSCQLVAGCPLPPLFSCFINYMCISVWWNMNACLFSFCPIIFFFLPLTVFLFFFFHQVSLSDEIWMHVPCLSLHHLQSVSAVGWNIDVCPRLELWMQNAVSPLQGKLCLSTLSTRNFNLWCFVSWNVFVATNINHLTG